jgi:hypothetical protein
LIDAKIKELKKELNELEDLAISERKATNYANTNFIEGEKQKALKFFEFLQELKKVIE